MKYFQKQLTDKKGKIVWLASYPKSGNTWFRCFITALFTDKIELNEIESTHGIFSSRVTFDQYSGIDSRLLLHKEVSRMLPEVYIKKAEFSKQLLFIKIHDAYGYNDMKIPIVPADATHKVIYFVRNPLDIVGSFANHNNSTVEATIKLMNDENTFLPDDKLEINNTSQLRQFMNSWSGHVESWLDQKNIDVILVRYEDMLKDGFATFSRIIEQLEIEASPKDIKRAMKLTSFSRLKKSEQESGFNEKNVKTPAFFRSGKSGGYKKELSLTQIDLIKKQHKKVMKKLNYL